MAKRYTSKTTRNQLREMSNNKFNPNKNLCVLSVYKALGVDKLSRYGQKWEDIPYTVRKRYTVRSRLSKVKGLTMGKAREVLAGMTEKEGLKPVGYIVGVVGHVFLVSPTGQTLVDTAPRKRDRRKIVYCWVVYDKRF